MASATGIDSERLRLKVLPTVLQFFSPGHFPGHLELVAIAWSRLTGGQVACAGTLDGSVIRRSANVACIILKGAIEGAIAIVPEHSGELGGAGPGFAVDFGLIVHNPLAGLSGGEEDSGCACSVLIVGRNGGIIGSLSDRWRKNKAGRE